MTLNKLEISNKIKILKKQMKNAETELGKSILKKEIDRLKILISKLG